MNRILRIVVGALTLLILIFVIVSIASQKNEPGSTPAPSQLETSVPTETPPPTPRPTRTPMPSPATPMPPTRTIDPSSGTSLPRPTLPSTYSNIPEPEDS